MISSSARFVWRQQRNLLRFPQIMASTSSNNPQKQAESSEGLNVTHSAKNKEFYIELDPPHRAVLLYDVLKDGSVDMHHTGVPSEYRGRGIAGQLAKVAFDHFTRSNTSMLLTCTYLQKYYRDHPEASRQDLISLPT